MVSKELQLISIERNGRQEDVRRQRNLSGKRKRQRIKRQRRKALAAILLVVLAALCYKTNWFTEAPFSGNAFAFLRISERSSGREIQRLLEREDYPEELKELLEQNEETLDFVKNYENREEYLNQEIDLSGDCRGKEAPLLMQWDKRWGYELYGDSMIGLSGCGPTCMTMAYLYYTGDTEMNPRRMAEFAQENGYHSEEGTRWSFWTEGAERLGLSGETIALNESIMKQVLDDGGLIVCSMSPGDFTTKGHYILVRGYDREGFCVNDPNRRSNSEKHWDYETLSVQIKNLWAIENIKK